MAKRLQNPLGLLTVVAILAVLVAFTFAFKQAQAGTAITVFNGGTGTSTVPTYGQMLIGGKNGEYEYVASSTLGAAAGVTSVFGRSGAVTAQSGDYTTSQVTEGSNLYWTLARGLSSFITNLAATTSVASITTLPSLSLPYSQLTGVPAFDTFAFPWTPLTNFGAAANSTSTPIWFQGGLQASSTIQAQNINIDQFSSYKQNSNTVLYASTTNYDLAIGASSAAAWMAASTSLQNNIAIGYGALATTPVNASAQYNLALGIDTLTNNTTGEYNNAFGIYALVQNTSGTSNNVFGMGAMNQNTNGSSNTAFGTDANYYNQSGGGSTDIGIYTDGFGNGGVASHYYNVDIGGWTGYKISTGQKNTFIGTYVASTTASGSNNIALGYDIALPSTNGSNQLDIGNLLYGTGINGEGTTISTGNIGIGTTSPSQTLSVQGNQYTSGTAFFGGAITATSTLTLTALTGTQCLHEVAGVVSGTGSDCGSGSSSFTYPFTNPSEFGTTTAATTTPIWAQQGLFASSTSQIASTTFSNGGNVTINNNVITTIGNTPAFPQLTLESGLNTYEAPNVGSLNMTDLAPDAKANIAFQVVSTSSPNTPVTKAWLNAPNLLLNWNVASFNPSAVNTTTGVFTAANNYGAGQSPNITAGYFSSSGTLPTGISGSTYYYVAGNNANEGTSFTVYTTAANAESLTSPIIPSTQGTGTITFTPDETYNGNQEYQFQIETTDETGTNMHGRFFIPFDQNTTPITLANANLFIAQDSGFTDGNESLQSQLCIGTPQCYGETMLGDAGNGWSNYYNTPFLISNTLNPKNNLATTSNYSEILQANTTTVGAGTGLGFMETTGGTGSSIGSSIVSYRDGSGGYSDLAFNTQNNSGNVLEGMRLTSTGNLGVGTTSPYARLSVQGNANDGNADMNLFAVGYSSASATTSLFTVTQKGNVGIGTTTPGVPFAIGFNSQNSASLPVQNIIEVSSTTAAGVSSNLLQLNSSGNLYIGTNFPTFTSGTTGDLSVTGQTSMLNNLFFPNAQSSTEGVTFAAVGSFNPALTSDPAGDIKFTPLNNVSGGTPYMYYTGKGYLGIGTSSPNALLGIQLDSNQSTLAKNAFTIASSSGTFATTTLFNISTVGQIVSSTTVPTLSSCGTSPSFYGDDAHMTITVGSVSATSCTATFGTPYPKKPTCNVTNQSMSVVNAMTYTESVTAITVSQTGLTGDILDINCFDTGNGG